PECINRANRLDRCTSPIEECWTCGHRTRVKRERAFLHGSSEHREVTSKDCISNSIRENRGCFDPCIIEGRGLARLLHAPGRSHGFGPLGRDRDDEAKIPVVERRKRLCGKVYVSNLSGRQFHKAAKHRPRCRSARLTSEPTEPHIVPVELGRRTCGPRK